MDNIVAYTVNTNKYTLNEELTQINCTSLNTFKISIILIETLVFDSKLLTLEFNSCGFNWVRTLRREANNVANTLTKFIAH
jgi:hypothetical protein